MMSDEILIADVERELASEPMLGTGRIAVAVYDGAVTLVGVLASSTTGAVEIPGCVVAACTRESRHG